jgi:hypothetical protein
MWIQHVRLLSGTRSKEGGSLRCEGNCAPDSKGRMVYDENNVGGNEGYSEGTLVGAHPDEETHI